MAYSNWTITGTGTNSAQLNSTASPTWAYGTLPSATYGTYCRKLGGDGNHLFECSRPELNDIPALKTVSIEYCFALATPYPVSNQYLLAATRASGTAPDGGYQIGAWNASNGYYFFMVRLHNGASYNLNGYWGWYPQGGFVPVRLVIKSISPTVDEIEAFVERDGGGNVSPGSGNWVSNALTPLSGDRTGVTMDGNVLTVPSTSPCFAPYVAGTKTYLYWTGGNDAYIDGVKFAVSDT